MTWDVWFLSDFFLRYTCLSFIYWLSIVRNLPDSLWRYAFAGSKWLVLNKCRSRNKRERQRDIRGEWEKGLPLANWRLGNIARMYYYYTHTSRVCVCVSTILHLNIFIYIHIYSYMNVSPRALHGNDRQVEIWIKNELEKMSNCNKAEEHVGNSGVKGEKREYN